jgi:WD40-like Beta Propeller Repeat
MTSTRRRRGFVVLVALCALTAAVAVASGVRQNDATASATSSGRAGDALAAATAQGRPSLVFRRVGDHPGADGAVGVSALGATGSRPAFASLRCGRVYFAGGRGLCLAGGRGFAALQRVLVLDSKLRVRHELKLPGIPSRARVSPDGRYGSVTMFVTGHAYSAAGAFSTQTTLIDLVRGAKLADLEAFSVTDHDKVVTAVDRNFWGVTFARDGDTFYATLATGGRTHLIKGSIRDRRAYTLRANVECPSLSPDGTRLAYKKRVRGGSSPWRLHVLELATMRDTALAESRSIDDQAEWLDDGTVLYGADGAIWSVPADGGGHPQRLMAAADSPAVVRSPGPSRPA